jgi:TrmH family RNA methyltransferase
MVFFTNSLLESERGSNLFQALKDCQEKVQVQEVTGEVLRGLAETDTPQGIVGVSRRGNYSLADLEELNECLVLIADGIQDPGNLGTMVRTAWAAGVKALVCLQGTVDPYNGKTIRSSMGGVFHLPIFTGIQWQEFSAWAHDQGFFLVAAELEGSDVYHRVDYKPKTALVIGNEGSGLLTVKGEEVDCRVRIPLQAGAESLNAGIACGIILFEIRKQLTEKGFTCKEE